MKLYHSEQEMYGDLKRKTIEICRQNDFDINQEHGEIMLCGKHGTDELIKVYPDGSWEVYNQRVSGPSAMDLKIMFRLGMKEYRSQMNSEV